MDQIHRKKEEEIEKMLKFAVIMKKMADRH